MAGTECGRARYSSAYLYASLSPVSALLPCGAPRSHQAYALSFVADRPRVHAVRALCVKVQSHVELSVRPLVTRALVHQSAVKHQNVPCPQPHSDAVLFPDFRGIEARGPQMQNTPFMQGEENADREPIVLLESVLQPVCEDCARQTS